MAKLSPLEKHKCRLLEMCRYRSEKLLKVKYSFFFSVIFLSFSLLSDFFPRLIALSHMVQHEMKVLSYMFKVALSISLLSFISDSQSLLIGESFLCCKMEYFFVSTPTISKSNNVLKSQFLLRCQPHQINPREEKITETLNLFVSPQFYGCLWICFWREKKVSWNFLM